MKPYYSIEEFQSFIYKYTQYIDTLSDIHQRQDALNQAGERFLDWIKEKRESEKN